MAKSKAVSFDESEQIEPAAVFEDMPAITIDLENGGVIEVSDPVPSIIEAHFPMFSKDGVLLNPGECEIGSDGVVRGKVV